MIRISKILVIFFKKINEHCWDILPTCFLTVSGWPFASNFSDCRSFHAICVKASNNFPKSPYFWGDFRTSCFWLKIYFALSILPVQNFAFCTQFRISGDSSKAKLIGQKAGKNIKQKPSKLAEIPPQTISNFHVLSWSKGGVGTYDTMTVHWYWKGHAHTYPNL